MTNRQTLLNDSNFSLNIKVLREKLQTLNFSEADIEKIISMLKHEIPLTIETDSLNIKIENIELECNPKDTKHIVSRCNNFDFKINGVDMFDVIEVKFPAFSSDSLEKPLIELKVFPKSI